MLSKQINESIAEISVRTREIGNYYPDPDPELIE